MNRPRVLHLVNSIGPTSIPLEIAEHIGRDQFDIVVLSYYDSNKEVALKKTNNNTKIIGIGARGKADIRAIFRLYRKMRRIAPDVLHTHHNLSGSLGRLFAKCLKVPVIVDTEHSVPSRNLRYTFGASLLNGLTLGFADAVVFNSNATRTSLPQWIACFVKPERERVIYNGVDIGRIESNLRRDLSAGCPLSEWVSKEQFVICNVGSLRPVKNQATLIEALELIRREAHDVKLVIVGGGPLEEELRKEIAERNLTSAVWLAGEVCRDMVYRILHACDVFVMTSLWEGFCVAVVEAMAARKPIIMTEVGALPEVVGSAGVFVPPRDPEAVAQAVLRIKNYPSEAEQIAKAAEQRGRELFPLEKTVTAYEDLYQELLMRKQHPRMHSAYEDSKKTNE